MNRHFVINARLFALCLTLTLAFSSTLSLAQKTMKQPSAGSNRNPRAKSLSAEQKAVHLLNRISYGPRPGDVKKVMDMGWEKFLDDQIHPERISDQLVEQKLQDIPSIHLSTEQLAAKYPPGNLIQQTLRARGIDLTALRARPQETTSQNNSQPQSDPTSADSLEDQAKRREVIRGLMQEMGWKPQQEALAEAQQAKILRAIYSERQLQEVLTDFWFNHFNVFAGKGPSRMFITPYERDVIRPHVFSKFADLLRATAQSPAMLFYLDNWQSKAPDARPPQAFRRFQEQRLGRPGQRGRGPVGQQPDAGNQLQMDRLSAAQRQRQSRGINENYAREIMELHTLGVDGGYTQKDVQEVARCFTGWTIRQPQRGGGFYFAQWMHDDGEKVVLGNHIPSGGGIRDGEAVIRILAHHPATARFIATKLARRFVSDHPPQSLIDRTAKVFLKTDGDLREVVRSILTSPEFWSAESWRAKIKTPFEMAVSAVRALGAETNGSPAFHRWIAQMGEPLYLAQPPTGYKDEAELWVNTGALLQRMNFALALSTNRIRGTRANAQVVMGGLKSTQPEQITDYVIELLLHGEVSPQTRATLSKQLGDQSMTAVNNRNTTSDVARIVGLVLGSPEFQRQ